MTTKELKELKQLIKVLRAGGVTQFKNAGVELTLTETAPENIKKTLTSEKALKAIDSYINEPTKNDYPTAEQFLFMASDGTLPKIDEAM